MKHPIYSYITALLLAVSTVGCQQKIWQPQASLQQTDVAVDSTLTADPETEAIIVPYRQQVTAKMSEVIGTAPVELRKADYESPLGNFVVDLLLEETNKLVDEPVDMAQTTNGGLRVPLPAGPITVGHIFELMPFENEVIVLTLDGPTTQELLDFAAKTGISPIANATYTIQNGKATNIKIGGKPLDTSRNYTIVTSDYLAGGGDNMVMFKKAIKSEKVGMMMRDMILKHIKELTAAGKPIVADTAKRVSGAQ
ncbi:5'-nucleotidase C-terminal domain-containing protein [Pontibacter sp. BT310]|uniref:5'-nucleotidase C-terminal domain-containing protein n=1 Tax=Pontibacter populi TaxID=890055 RepID=A0ABS6X790_9BACT|nr:MULTISPECIES: 5'-nucleotidase [Pontibacter]MBJ6117012.1 5'-nucleotidase C-terminal domain-containing protein [Pontibacter sp. BT310]MBR0569436.1 5'-nucleotidase C-terminal domain-containing protein [Microvirga sp. STS03]MBW3363865.1 5'-nucleotidase C-terminal domain-containing protein [Pontibacter populi]